MSVQSRVEALATRVANYLRDSVVPRMLPGGGTQGQVLAKTSGADHAVGWSTPQKITVGTAPPVSPAVNDLWLDTN